MPATSLPDAWLRAAPELPVRVQQTAYLVTVFALPLLAAATASGRAQIAAHPRRTVLLLLLLDLGYMLWVTLPFVPVGVDETFYAINAHVYAGNTSLWHCWNRPPLTSIGAMLFPWHPPLVGLLMRSASAWFAYLLAERAVRAPWAVVAPLLVLVAARLSEYGASLLSEPYGAAFLAGFALAATRGAGGWLGLIAAGAFLSRWPLGWLLPLAVAVAFGRQRWRGAALACASFAVPVAAVVLATGVRPWAMLGDRSAWTRPVLDTLAYYLEPDVAFGVGWSHLGLLAVAAVGVRAPAVRWCLLLFTACAGVLVAMGEATVRFMAPAVPVAAVAATAGLQWIGGRMARRWPSRPALAGLLVAVTALSVAFPVRPLRARSIKLQSPQGAVRAGRAELLRALGDAPLYCDCNFIAVTAVLDHRCHAVPSPPDVADEVEPRRFQPPGVGLDLEGATPPCERAQLPPGVFYLTYDPAGREVLWRGGGLSLVRW